MAYNNQQEKDNRPRSPFDLFALTRWAPSPTAQGKSASFNLDVDDAGRVSFIVRTGDPADKERMRDGDIIRIKLGLDDFERFAIKFGDMLREKGPCKIFFTEQVKFRWDNDAKKRVALDQPRDGIKLVIGKDSEGVVFMALTQFKKTEIEFGFVNERPEFIFQHADGTPFSRAENSVIGARAYHKLLTELHSRIEAGLARVARTPDKYKPPFVPQQGSGNGSGGYNKGNSNGSGGYNGGNRNNASAGNSGGVTPQAAPASEFVDTDDEIPY